MEKGFFILSNLKAIDFGSKVFSYLSPALKFSFFLHPIFLFPSVKVVVFILSQHTAFQFPFVLMSKFSDHLVGETRPKRNICLCGRKWNRNCTGYAKAKGALSIP